MLHSMTEMKASKKAATQHIELYVFPAGFQAVNFFQLLTDDGSTDELKETLGKCHPAASHGRTDDNCIACLLKTTLTKHFMSV